MQQKTKKKVLTNKQFAIKSIEQNKIFSKKTFMPEKT